VSVQSGGDVVSLLLEPGTLTYRRLRPPASSPVKCTLTRAKSAASPAAKRERRVISGAERDTLTWARYMGGRGGRS
jgi:hypothetical protein